MIQRIQSVWLLLATALIAMTFALPFYNGDWLKDSVTGPVDLNALSTIWLTVLTVWIATLSFITIFVFRNRKLQIKLVYLGLFLTLGLIALYVLEMQNFTNGRIALYAIFPAAAVLFFIFAARGISKDEKLIKSLDRLR